MKRNETHRSNWWRHLIYLVILIVIPLIGCRKEQTIQYAEEKEIPLENYNSGNICGIYLLNQGAMGTNNATLDFIDLRKYKYIKNIYSERNPTAVKELGDVGNDLQIYGSKLYAVINCSHKVEVLRVADAKRIGKIDIDNCRYIVFDGPNAYVTSYVGGVGDPNSPLGQVVRFDTATLEITGKVDVGYQPDGLAIKDGLIFVANSGGYRSPKYDSTVSVIDCKSMTELYKIPVARNLNRLHIDKYGKIWVTSRGDYQQIPPRLHILQHNPEKQKYELTKTLNIACTEFVIQDDKLYFYAVDYIKSLSKPEVSYGVIDITNYKLLDNAFIAQNATKGLKTPYGITIHPVNGDFFICDAKGYTSNGELFWFSKEGSLRLKLQTGNIPCCLAFVKR